MGIIKFEKAIIHTIVWEVPDEVANKDGLGGGSGDAAAAAARFSRVRGETRGVFKAGGGVFTAGGLGSSAKLEVVDISLDEDVESLRFAIGPMMEAKFSRAAANCSMAVRIRKWKKDANRFFLPAVPDRGSEVIQSLTSWPGQEDARARLIDR